jgi:hypothetical protein
MKDKFVQIELCFRQKNRLSNDWAKRQYSSLLNFVHIICLTSFASILVTSSPHCNQKAKKSHQWDFASQHFMPLALIFMPLDVKECTNVFIHLTFADQKSKYQPNEWRGKNRCLMRYVGFSNNFLSNLLINFSSPLGISKLSWEYSLIMSGGHFRWGSRGSSRSCMTKYTILNWPSSLFTCKTFLRSMQHPWDVESFHFTSKPFLRSMQHPWDVEKLPWDPNTVVFHYMQSKSMSTNGVEKSIKYLQQRCSPQRFLQWKWVGIKTMKSKSLGLKKSTTWTVLRRTNIYPYRTSVEKWKHAPLYSEGRRNWCSRANFFKNTLLQIIFVCIHVKSECLASVNREEPCEYV